ncbi:lymphocyte-specific helicase-like [Bolinopsis microptera]|uniref:lymphocyte-specific helicase-like n=1 Tax=Bolinopsis microptera TaxID=2820187 RepID=UPI003079DC71
MNGDSVSTEEQILSPKSKCSIQVPENLLSPPTSRSNSPVEEMPFSREGKDSGKEKEDGINQDSVEKKDVPEDPVGNDGDDGEGLKLDAVDMKKQEQQIAEDNKIRDEAVSQISEMNKDRRYDQLMHLLEKSSIYTGFLLDRLKAEEAVKAKQEEKVKKQVEKSATSTRGRRNSKRKKTTVSDVIDKQELLKRQRINEQGDSVGTSSQETERKEEVAKLLQPALITGAVLRDYQLYGVNWITSLYENGMNGILADEMGLGKTIQTIGLLASLIERGVSGPYLVVAPLSTLSNWKREFDNFAPSIPTVLFHASKTERPKLYKHIKKQYDVRIEAQQNSNKTYPVVITSYEMISLEYSFLSNFQWRFIIVDEGHKIKNINCTLIKHLKGLHSDNRLLLTGTPLQNNLSELWSLLNFILPSVFDDLNAFQMWFDFSALSEDGGKEKIIANEKEGQVLSKLHQILSPFLLRRLKTDVELKIPPKVEVHVYATMTALQEKYYKAILEKKIFELITEESGVKEVLEKNERGLRKKKQVNYDEDMEDVNDANGFVDPSQWSSIGVKEDIYKAFSGSKALSQGRKNVITSALKMMWVQLKKCCNHPYLIKYPCDADGYAVITDEVLNCSGKMLLLHRMLPALINGGHKVLIFSTMTTILDIIEDYLSLYDWKYSRLDGSMSYDLRDENIHRFQNDPQYKIFLLSTRAGGLGLNLMAADTVILYDSDWNPQCDLQAQDRAHRIGQKNKVMVYRLLAKNTMDQKIVERGISKRFLEKMVIHKGKFKSHAGKGPDNVSEEDLKELFDSEALDALNTEHRPEDILSDQDLAALVDRDNELPKSKAYTIVENVATEKY